MLLGHLKSLLLLLILLQGPEAAAQESSHPGLLRHTQAVHVVVPEREDKLSQAVPVPRPLDTTPLGQEEALPLVQQGGVTTCPAGQSFVKFCMDSAMEISTTGGWIPPSPHGAAGPWSLIAVTNSWIECRWKDNSDNDWTPGQVVFSSSLKDLFKPLVPKADPTSPRVLYDVHLDRFIVIAEEISFVDNTVVDARILLAVSKDYFPWSESDDYWYTGRIYCVDTETFATVSGVAVDKEAFYITSNNYNKDPRAYVGSFLWIVHKEHLFTSGGNSKVTIWNIDQTGAPVPDIPHVPAVVRSNTGIFGNYSAGTYLVAFSGLTDGTNRFIQVVQVTDPLGSTKFRAAQVSVGNIDDLSGVFPYAPQLGSQIRIFTGDHRAQNAVWVKNSLWFVATVKSASDRAEAYWFQLRADKSHWPPTVMDHGPIDGELIVAGGHTYYPSLDVNSKNVAAFGFTASSTNIFVGAYATIRYSTDSRGTVRSPEAVKAGRGSYNIGSGSNNIKWGYYSGTSIDPYDDDCFWVFNAYTGERSYTTYDGQFGEWKTAWAKLCTQSLGNAKIISSGTEIVDLHADKEQKLNFKLKETVPAGQNVSCILQVPNGDADLYVKFGSVPQGPGAECDCNSENKGRDFDEDCTTRKPAKAATHAYIAVVATKASANMGLLCYINDINCRQENKSCKQSSQCCGTMVCDETTMKCAPCKKPQPCGSFKCGLNGKACKSPSQCCRWNVCNNGKCSRKG